MRAICSSARGILDLVAHRVGFSNTDLSGPDLSLGTLVDANLKGATLFNTNLSGAHLGYTVFGDVDLSTVKGLETVNHHGPSTIGIDTIYRSQGKIPEVFLKEAGMIFSEKWPRSRSIKWPLAKTRGGFIASVLRSNLKHKAPKV